MHGGGTATYVVPDGFRAIVRDIDGFNPDLVLPAVIEAHSVDNGYTFFQQDLSAQSWGMWRGRQVFDEGESFMLVGADSSDMAASGYLLTLP